MEKIIKMLKQEARDSWNGDVGEQRAIKLEKFLRSKLEEYSRVLEITQEEILKAWEENRDYTAINYYQEAHFPKLENVEIFETMDDYKIKYHSRLYICPSCGKESTDPYECSQVNCGWESYGLFGTLDKGLRVIIKQGFLERSKVNEIFMPIENAVSLK